MESEKEKQGDRPRISKSSNLRKGRSSQETATRGRKKRWASGPRGKRGFLPSERSSEEKRAPTLERGSQRNRCTRKGLGLSYHEFRRETVALCKTQEK